ncbi:MAG: hypothetical protein IFK92_07735 [Acidobacteria bacterium]|nr:hypothetical protein [Candidatus Sulfomarinibacter kjeldsenii]
MLIATVASWALAGVVGVAMTTALILRSVGWILPERKGRGSWMAWLVVGFGAAIGLAGMLWVGAPYAVGEAIFAAGLVMLALTMEPTDSDSSRHVFGWTVGAAHLLAASAVMLPAVAWRGLFGMVLFLTAVWLATRARGEDRRLVFDLAVAPIAFAGIGLMLGVIRPSFAIASEAAVGLLLVGGTATLAAATVVTLVGSEINLLRTNFANLEDEHGHLYPEPLQVNWGVSSCAAASDISSTLAEADERMYAMKRRRRHDASSDDD